MPLRSLAQLRKFAQLVKEGKLSEEKFQEWLRATPDPEKLPERTPKQKPMQLKPVKVIK